MAQITITIDPSVESVGLQTIGVALGMTSVTDEQVRVALGANLRNQVAQLYVRGDQLKRASQADAAAVAAAASKITVV